MSASQDQSNHAPIWLTCYALVTALEKEKLQYSNFHLGHNHDFDSVAHVRIAYAVIICRWLRSSLAMYYDLLYIPVM